MGADQIAEIRPPIVEVFDGAAVGEAWCATFTVTGCADRWIQVTRDSINVSYPWDSDPSALLVELPVPPFAELRVTSWEARKFVTFTFGRKVSARDVAKVVDVLFESVLGCAGVDYSVDVEFFSV
jgi:hypothetical protein